MNAQDYDDASDEDRLALAESIEAELQAEIAGAIDGQSIGSNAVGGTVAHVDSDASSFLTEHRESQGPDSLALAGGVGAEETPSFPLSKTDYTGQFDELPEALGDADLNDAQREAVAHVNGPFLMLAGAGVGKTRVLVHRVAHLVIAEAVPTFAILAVTFTNKAAAEMRARFDKALGPTSKDLWVGTFHAICARLLRRFHQAAGLRPGFSIYDTTDQKRVLRRAAKQLDLGDAVSPDRALARISSLKQSGKGPEIFDGCLSSGDVAFRDLYVAYQEKLAEANAVDFDDLLLKVLAMCEPSSLVAQVVQPSPDVRRERYAAATAKRAEALKPGQTGGLFQAPATPSERSDLKRPPAPTGGAAGGKTSISDAGRAIRRMFRHVLVDEFQDVNEVQYRLARALSEESNNLCVVGDDDQCHPPGVQIEVEDGTWVPVEALDPNADLVRGWSEATRTLSPVGRRFTIARRPFSGKVYTLVAGGCSVPITGNHKLVCMWASNPKIGTFEVSGEDLDTILRGRIAHGDLLVPIPDPQGVPLSTSMPRPRATDPSAQRKDERDENTEQWRENAPAHGDRAGGPLRIGERSGFEARRESGDRGQADQGRSGGADRAPLSVGREGQKGGVAPAHPGAWTSSYSGDDKKSLPSAGLSCSSTPLWGSSGGSSAGDQRRDADVSPGERRELKGPGPMALAGVQGAEPPAGFGAPCLWVPVNAVMVRPYTGYVYSLDVEEDHCYVANGVIVKNSIYTWRGAVPAIFDAFIKDHPGAKIVKLEQNYRSTGNVVRAASSLIAKARGRQAKTLWTAEPTGDPVYVITCANEDDEGSFVARRIADALSRGIALSELAVLYRVHAQSRAIEEALRSAKIAYRVLGGQRFYERTEIKDALSYLRLAANPQSDVDFLRVLNVPARGVGETTAERLARVAADLSSSLFEAAAFLRDDATTGRAALGKRGYDAVMAFHAIVDDLIRYAMQGALSGVEVPGPGAGVGGAQPPGGPGPTMVLARALERTGYVAMLRKSEDGDARVDVLRELSGTMLRYEEEAAQEKRVATLSGYLERVALDSGEEKEAGSTGVTLMTVHAAKGLEFKEVMLTGMEEGVFPYVREQNAGAEEDCDEDEERRLAYVAVTRAREKLWISWARMRTLYGQTRASVPSRFLADLPADAVKRGRSTGVAPAQKQGAPPPAPPTGGSAPGAPARALALDPAAHDIRGGGAQGRVDEAAAPGEMREGARVAHRSWGIGVVSELDGDFLVARFKAHGERRIHASYVRVVA